MAALVLPGEMGREGFVLHSGVETEKQAQKSDGYDASQGFWAEVLGF